MIGPALRYPRPATSTATASTTSSSGPFAGAGPATHATSAGDSYVVFGKASGFAAEIDLAAVAAGNGGFVIHGAGASDQSAIRCPRPATSTATASTTSSSGQNSATARTIHAPGGRELCAVRPRRRLCGGDRPRCGRGRQRRLSSSMARTRAISPAAAVSLAGDVNGDGFAAEIDLATIAAGNGGFIIHGQDAGDEAGFSVSSAGDVNGDGFDDLIVGAFRSDGRRRHSPRAGDSYVVFGHAGGFAARDRPGRGRGRHGGFIIHGEDAGDHWRDVRSPRPATSTATASTTSSSAHDADGPGNTRTERATAMWCSARPAALRRRSTSPRSRPAMAASSSMARTRTITSGHSVVLGRRRQRRRLRRPRHRGMHCRRPRRYA